MPSGCFCLLSNRSTVNEIPVNDMANKLNPFNCGDFHLNEIILEATTFEVFKKLHKIYNL